MQVPACAITIPSKNPLAANYGNTISGFCCCIAIGLDIKIFFYIKPDLDSSPVPINHLHPLQERFLHFQAVFLNGNFFMAFFASISRFSTLMHLLPLILPGRSANIQSPLSPSPNHKSQIQPLKSNSISSASLGL